MKSPLRPLRDGGREMVTLITVTPLPGKGPGASTPLMLPPIGAAGHTSGDAA
ncbi:hypothetical protein [Roseobacter denitrificans]|uniref:Uncharacterized protein n=1 Tax=Roseobacter denitrificans (strain ATCC 33942 / OCh 114) TaxID=375451 RepID=Q167F8_ROSDO|nr:hypothetical protein [Roseobacter denitrificans]ABG31885.1 hypothetical protein RD1_2305 [Roseobacter denitrificans OCh 114]